MNKVTEAIRIYESNGQEVIFEFNQDGTLTISSVVSANNQLSDDQIKSIKLDSDSREKLKKYLCKNNRSSIMSGM